MIGLTMMKVMKTSEKEFKKLLKNYSAKKIIQMHVMSEINLTSKQLDKLIELKNKGE